MKNLLLTLTLTAAVAAPLTLGAQEPKPERPKQAREGGPGPGGPSGGRMNPEERLKRMTEQLSLTEEQQGKIKAIFEEGQAEMAKLRDVPEGERREKGREFFQKQNDKVLAVLTPEQQEKYKKAMAERMREGGQRPGGPRGEGAPDRPREGRKASSPEGGAKPEGAKTEEKK